MVASSGTGRRPPMNPEAGEPLVLAPTAPTALRQVQGKLSSQLHSLCVELSDFMKPTLWTLLGKSPPPTENEGNVRFPVWRKSCWKTGVDQSVNALGDLKAKVGSTWAKSATRVLRLLGEWVNFGVIWNCSVHFGNLYLTEDGLSTLGVPLEREDPEPLGDYRRHSLIGMRKFLKNKMTPNIAFWKISYGSNKKIFGGKFSLSEQVTFAYSISQKHCLALGILLSLVLLSLALAKMFKWKLW